MLISQYRAKLKPRGDCLIWTGWCDPEGYGRLTCEGQLWRAHRFAWHLANGPIPKGMLICHHCDAPACCNPGHLFLGTPADNMADKMRKGRHVPPVGEKNGQAKLTAAKARAVHRAKGIHSKIATRFGVSESLVSLIKAGKRWPSITRR